MIYIYPCAWVPSDNCGVNKTADQLLIYLEEVNFDLILVCYGVPGIVRSKYMISYCAHKCYCGMSLTLKRLKNYTLSTQSGNKLKI